MVEIRFFGQLSDITNTESVFLENLTDTDTAMNKVIEMYPLLKDATFKMALNNKLVNENSALAENSVIAFMPPYSGG